MHAYCYEAKYITMKEGRKDNLLGPTKANRALIYVLKYTLIAFLIVIPIRFFVAQPFVVAGDSMHPAIDAREYLVIDELSYRLHDPVRGDVIVFRYPFDSDQYFIKRIIALPGETVHIADGRIRITQVGADSPIVLHEPYIPASTRTTGSVSIVLSEDEYFVLGDNRAVSADSRQWGPLHKRYIIGSALARLLPLSRIAMYPGIYRPEIPLPHEQK